MTTLLLLLSTPNATAQIATENSSVSTSDDTEAKTATDTEESAIQNITQARPIEEIRVTGTKTLLTVRTQIERAKLFSYKLFNELNSDDKFDIKCRTTRRTSSYIPVRNCEPQFHYKERQENAAAAMVHYRDMFVDGEVNHSAIDLGNSVLDSEIEIVGRIQDDYEAMNEDMLRVALENPEYLKMLENIAELKADYAQMREDRFGK